MPGTGATRRLGVQHGAILTDVQVPPLPLGLKCQPSLDEHFCSNLGGTPTDTFSPLSSSILSMKLISL